LDDRLNNLIDSLLETIVIHPIKVNIHDAISYSTDIGGSYSTS